MLLRTRVCAHFWNLLTRDPGYSERESYDDPRQVRKWRLSASSGGANSEGTLVEVNVPADVPARRPRSIGDTPFAGLWKDREDVADSVEYINQLRRELHG